MNDSSLNYSKYYKHTLSPPSNYCQGSNSHPKIDSNFYTKNSTHETSKTSIQAHSLENRIERLEREIRLGQVNPWYEYCSKLEHRISRIENGTIRPIPHSYDDLNHSSEVRLRGPSLSNVTSLSKNDLFMFEARIEKAIKKQAEDIALDITQIERQIESMKQAASNVSSLLYIVIDWVQDW